MIVILGLWGFFAPNSVSIFVRSWSTVGGMWLAVALRLGFGAALWLAAPLSRTEVPLKSDRGRGRSLGAGLVGGGVSALLEA